MAGWYSMLKAAMEGDGECFADRYCTLDEKTLKKNWGAPFTAWGEKWVYFPLDHNGFKTVGHAPRNPCDIAMEDQP